MIDVGLLRVFLSSLVSLNQIFALALLGIVLGGWTSARAGSLVYEGVIDAGSSGTRLYLYALQSGPQGPSVSLLLEDEPDSLRGLSNYAEKPEQAGQGEIAPLLNRLEAFLQAKSIDSSAVRVSVLATAGMRLVDPIATARIYESVRHEIVSRGFTVREVGTITGQSEGIYAWVDVNYLKGNLRPGQPTEGIVEIGGASAQIALAVHSSDQHSDLIRHIRIGDQAYNVLSVSYLGLGQNEARRAMIEKTKSEALDLNPCYPNSHSERVVFDAVKGRKGVEALKVAATKSLFTQACFELYTDVLQSTSALAMNNFPIAQFHSVPGFESKNFILMASFYLKLKDWDLLGDKHPDRSLLAEVFGRCVGADAWATVSGRQGTGFFAQNACANATYLYTFIFSSRGLALPSSRVQALGDVNGESLTWTRGYALLVANSSK